MIQIMLLSKKDNYNCTNLTSSEIFSMAIVGIWVALTKHRLSYYRGITICNSIGKVFNSILNNRLDKCLVENNIIHENQIGFSKKSRTSDHIFVLKCIIEKYLKTDTKKLFVCFVDFHKAFDTVIHPGIRYKLVRNGINGLFYKIICNMYSVHQDRGQTT